MANIKDHVSVIREGQDLLPGGEGQDFWPPHAPTHEEGGNDVINVNNLLGTLADPQNAGWVQGIPVPDDTVTPNDGDTFVYSQGTGEWVYGPPIPGASIWARDNGAGFIYPITPTDELRMGDGNAGTPAYAFLSAGDTGLFWEGHGPALSIGGLKTWLWTYESPSPGSGYLSVVSNYRTQILAQHDGAVSASSAVMEVGGVASSSGATARGSLYGENTAGRGKIDIHATAGGVYSSDVEIYSTSTGTDIDSFITLGGEASGSGLRYLRLGDTIGETPMLFDSIRFGTRSLDSTPAWTQNYLEFCEPGNTTQWTEYRNNFGQQSLIQAVNLAYSVGGGGVVRVGDTDNNTLPRWNGDNVSAIKGSGILVSDANEVSGIRMIDLEAAPGSVAFKEGRFFYDQDFHTLGVFTDIPDVTLQVGQESYIRVFNNTGSNIPNGTPVYVSGAFSNLPTVALAKADDPATAYAAGLTTHEIIDGQAGFVTTMGGVTMDTSTFSGGDVLFVSATVAGELVSTPPEGGNLNVAMGHVYVVGVQGRVQVRRWSIPVKTDKTFLVPADIITSTNGSTLTQPRVIGATDFSSGESFAYQMGNTDTAIQNGFDRAVQFYAYRPITLLGDRGASGPPSFEDITGTGVLMRGTQTGSVVAAIQAASGQTANLLEFRNAAGTPLSQFLANGDLDLNGSSIINDTARLVEYSGEVLYLGQDDGSDVTPAIDLEAGATTNFSIGGSDIFRVQSTGMNCLNHDVFAAKTITFNQWPTVTASGGDVTVAFANYQKATVNLNNSTTVDITINTPNGPGNFMIELVQGSTTATTTINWITQGTTPLDEPAGGLSFNSDTDGRTAIGLYYTGSRWGIVGTPMVQLLAS